MLAVIQRVKQAHVSVQAKVVGRIAQGIVILLGVAKGDSPNDADFLTKKIAELRIFEDEQGKMNRSAAEAKGEFLVVSQFTLLGNCRKGRRPSFDAAAEPEAAKELYTYFVTKLKETGLKVETGEFAAMMNVSLVNDGPVTLIVDSRAI